MYKQGDTIVALSTPQGRGAIAVVRLSGPDCIRTACGCLDEGAGIAAGPPGFGRVANIKDPADGTVVDQAVVTLRRAPASFTGEDMAEISLHGGLAVVARVLAMLSAAGARPASPGEFTMRAFLNGKMDLARAEAVAELIAADSRVQAEFAARALLGSVSREIERLERGLLDLVADAEAAVEFPEDGTPDLSPAEAVTRIDAMSSEAARLAATYREGRLISRGAAVVIAGPPNAGKSSLFNRLAGEDKAIVADIPGTTRDVLECRLEWDGMLVRLFDTAGLRETGDEIEMIGNERAVRQVGHADAVIYVIDGTGAVSERDLEFLEGLGGRVVVAFNKSDLASPAAGKAGRGFTEAIPSVSCSALTGDGITDLQAAVAGLLNSADWSSGDAVVITNARHHALLEESAGLMKSAAADLESGATVDLVLDQLGRALAALGGVTGSNASSEVMERIFSKFCVGK
jgi:tRNA modification GTPase